MFASFTAENPKVSERRSRYRCPREALRAESPFVSWSVFCLLFLFWFGSAEVKHSKCNRKRSKMPYGGVSRQIRPRCAVGVLRGMRERPRASPAGFGSSRGFWQASVAGVGGGRRWLVAGVGGGGRPGGVAGEAAQNAGLFN